MMTTTARPDEYDLRAEAQTVCAFYADHERCQHHGATMGRRREGGYLVLDIGCPTCGAEARARFDVAQVAPMLRLQDSGELVPLEGAPNGAAGWLSLEETAGA